MKKIFPILLLSMILGVFSSCIIIPPETVEEPTYTITFHNDLSDTNRNDVFDWYAKNESGKTFAVSSNPTPVSSGGGTSKLRNLRKNNYCIVFTFDDTTDYDDEGDTFYESYLFTVDKDTDCYLQEYSRDYRVTVRSAVNQSETIEKTEKGFQIVDSNGNIYPLTKVEK